MLRKIRTPEDVEKSRKKKQMLVGIVLVLLMVVSTAGFSLMSGDDEGEESVVEELGMKFYWQGGIWKTQIGEQVYAFQFLPSEVDNVSVNGSFNLGEYSGEPLYFVGSAEGVSEVLSNIGRYALRYQGACLNESVCEDNYPVKSCGDNLIVFEEGNETMVYRNESCVYLVGDSVKSADAFLYKVLKIK